MYFADARLDKFVGHIDLRSAQRLAGLPASESASGLGFSLTRGTGRVDVLAIPTRQPNSRGKKHMHQHAPTKGGVDGSNTVPHCSGALPHAPQMSSECGHWCFSAPFDVLTHPW